MFDVDQDLLVRKLAEELKERIEMPEWALFVKTGMHKERPPVEKDWWFVRAAAILRQLYLKQPVGVSKLRVKFGGKKRNRGMKPEHFYKGSGKVVRVILQELEKAGLVEKGERGVHKGRVLTREGVSLIFSVAKGLSTPEKPKRKGGVKVVKEQAQV